MDSSEDSKVLCKGHCKGAGFVPEDPVIFPVSKESLFKGRIFEQVP